MTSQEGGEEASRLAAGTAGTGHDTAVGEVFSLLVSHADVTTRLLRRGLSLPRLLQDVYSGA